MLPEIHGLRVIEKIRRLPQGQDVPVILMSAIYASGDLFKSDIKRLGLLGFIGTPLSLTDVGQKLDDILNGEDNGRALVRSHLKDAGNTGAAAGVENSGSGGAPGRLPLSAPPNKPPGPSTEENSAEGFVRALAELMRTRSSGRITLHGSGSWRRIIMNEGVPVWVEVSDLMDGLPRFLLEHKLLSISAMRQLAESPKAKDGDLPGALAELELVESSKISEVLTSWVAAEVARGLSHEGRYEYEPAPGLDPAQPAYEVNPLIALWDGLSVKVTQESIDEDLRGLANETIARSSTFSQLAASLAEAPALVRLTEHLDHPRNIEDLRLLLGDPDGQTSRAFWFLLTSGALTLSDAAAEGGPANVQAVATPTSTEAAEGSKGPQTGGMEHHVEFKLQSASQDSTKKEKEGPAASKDPVGTVRLDYINKMSADHYGFLEIDRTALATDIDDAYQSLAPRYRRQSLPEDVDDETKRMARELLARLVSVYEELNDPARRARYDVLGPERHEATSKQSKPVEPEAPATQEVQPSAGESVDSAEDAETASEEGAEPSSGEKRSPGSSSKRWSDELSWYPGCDDAARVRQRSAQLDEEDSKLLLQAHEFMSQQKFKLAFGLLDGLREGDPSNSGLLADLGWCRFAQEADNERNIGKALEWVDLSLAFDPGYRDALEAKARILCRCGLDDQVIPVLESLVGIAPELEWAVEELAERKEALAADETPQKKGGLRSLLGRKS